MTSRELTQWAWLPTRLRAAADDLERAVAVLEAAAAAERLIAQVTAISPRAAAGDSAQPAQPIGCDGGKSGDIPAGNRSAQLASLRAWKSASAAAAAEPAEAAADCWTAGGGRPADGLAVPLTAAVGRRPATRPAASSGPVVSSRVLAVFDQATVEPRKLAFKEGGDDVPF